MSDIIPSGDEEPCAVCGTARGEHRLTVHAWTPADDEPAPRRATDEDKAAHDAERERLAWLPDELIERTATEWALREGYVALDDVPAYDPDDENRDRFQQLLDFTAWAREEVWPAWKTEQASRAVPLACPPWCSREHGELIGDEQILPIDELATHESKGLEPQDSQILANIVQVQYHPDAAAEPFGPIQLVIQGEAYLQNPLVVRSLAAHLQAAADVFETAQLRE